MKKITISLIAVLVISVVLSGCDEQKTSNYDIYSQPNPIETKVDIVSTYYLTGWGQSNQAKSGDWSIRTPFNSILGFYDSGDPKIANAHIKMAVEKGVNTFIVVTSRPAAHWEWEKNFEDGLLQSDYLPHINFCMMFNNGPWRYENVGGISLKDLTFETIDYFADNFFNHPQYLYIDNKPVVILYQAFVHHNIFGFDSLKEVVDDIRNAANGSGYEIYLIGDVMEYVRDDWWLPEIIARVDLFDAITSYVILDAGLSSNYSERVLSSYEDMVEGYQNTSMFFYNISSSLDIDFIPPVTVGFNNSYIYNIGKYDYLVDRKDPSPELFGKMLENALEFVDYPSMIIIEAWNEFHEGTVLEPTLENKYSYLDQVKSKIGI